MAGKFITFEGGEGSGKSTQARRLADRLRQAGREVVETREPGGSAFAERVRALILDPSVPAHGPLSEALLFGAARADHLAATILPALDAGHWVVCDRFADSTRVYQGAAGGLDPAVVRQLEEIVVGATRPDLTILLDIDAAAGLARAKSRGLFALGQTDSFESRTLDFHERLRAGFLALAAAEPTRVAVIDAAGDLDAIAEAVWRAVEARLAPGAR